MKWFKLIKYHALIDTTFCTNTFSFDEYFFSKILGKRPADLFILLPELGSGKYPLLEKNSCI